MQRQVDDPETAFVFMSLRRSRVTGDFEPLPPSGVLQIVKQVAAGARIGKRVYSHLLRHTMATSWLQGGGSALMLQGVLGHNDLTMITKHYGHLEDTDRYDAMLRYLNAGPASQ